MTPDQKENLKVTFDKYEELIRYLMSIKITKELPNDSVLDYAIGIHSVTLTTARKYFEIDLESESYDS